MGIVFLFLLLSLFNVNSTLISVLHTRQYSTVKPLICDHN